MVTDNKPVEDVYDPDAPPESGYGDFIGVLAISTMVSPATFSEAPEHIQKALSNYWEKGGRKGPSWYLEAHGISVVRSDGEPYRQTDILPLTDKTGKWLGKKMAPDHVAQQYRGLGVSASYLRVGEPDSAVGRIFHFVGTSIALGKKFSKSVTLFPVEIMPKDYKYEGEVAVVNPSSSEGSNGSAPTAPKVSADDAVKLLQASLVGKTPAQMFEAILESSELKSVGTIFGVSLMEAATDESLAKVLTENGVLTLTEAGTFAVPA